MMSPATAGSCSLGRMEVKSSWGGVGDQPAMLSPPRSINSTSILGLTDLAASRAVCTALAVVMPLRGLQETPMSFRLLPLPASAARAAVEVAARRRHPRWR
jgi:hypothetical protein